MKEGIIMNLTIINPHKVDHKIYKKIILISLLVLFAVLLIPENYNDILIKLIDIIKNLSYGCIASTVVAWLIEYSNVANMNEKAENIYSAVYSDIKYQITFFIGIWAELCAAAYKDNDYHTEQHTWIDWYKLTRDNYYKLEERQEHIFDFFHKELKYCVDKVRNSIEVLQSQKYLLAINGLTNSDLNAIISDFRFEFYALDLDLSRKDSIEQFWTHMDAIIKDLEQYISNWNDICYYNYLEFKPYKFHNDNEEIYKAIRLSKDTIIKNNSKKTK